MEDSKLDTKSILIKAYRELKRVKGELAAVRTQSSEPIAVIGMDCRFPEAPNPTAFWKLLKNGGSAISEVPKNRWDWRNVYEKNQTPNPGKTNSKWGAFVDDVEYFDPLFFDISPREAVTIDPQQRLFLEVAWRTFEGAGYSKEKLSGSRTGVFVGSTYNGYYRYIEPYLTTADFKAGLGNENGIIPNRVSYFFNLRGPSILINTLCSSSLVAIDRACQSIRQKDCEMALVGGVNLQISSDYYVNMTRMNILSGSGKCHTFSEEADGIVLGEGAGAILLKTWSKAIEDGDRILGIIKGSATNHGGTANGLTAPNPSAQAALIEDALANAGLSAEAISYVEAHGTGTPLGDPIEIEGLRKAYEKHTSKKQYCHIGSVKTNIGHLEAAAGIAQVIKVLLCLQHRQLPPHLNYNKPNSLIDFADSPFVVNTELIKWEEEAPRRAGISSFGLGGTNAHLILEEAPPVDLIAASAKADKPYRIFCLSGKNIKALEQRIAQFDNFLNKHNNIHPHDLVRNANLKQSHFPLREAFVFTTIDDLKRQLGTYSAGTSRNNPLEKQIAFLFTGQGSQYQGMGRELYKNEERFRTAIDRCAELLDPHWTSSLTQVLFEKEELLHQTQYTQPALFALEYALAKCWIAWGVSPDYLLGHSIGEYALACIAGVFNLEDGMKLVIARGKLMQELPDTGTMLTVYATIEVLKPYLDKELQIAAYNGRENLVISGSKERIEKVAGDLNHRQIRTRLLQVSHAFHSTLMDPMVQQFAEVASQVSYHPPQYPIVSTVTGNFVQGEMSTPEYWIQHILSPVKFQPALERLMETGLDSAVEIGPNPTLIALARGVVSSNFDTQWFPSLRKKNPDTFQMLTSLKEFYKSNKAIDWTSFYSGESEFDQLDLPPYPFQRAKYWLGEANKLKNNIPKTAQNTHPLLGRSLSEQNDKKYTWQADINPDQLRFMTDQLGENTLSFPLAAYIEMTAEATRLVVSDQNYEIKYMDIKQQLTISKTAKTSLQSTLAVSPDGSLQFQVFSLFDKDRTNWILCAEAEIMLT